MSNASHFLNKSFPVGSTCNFSGNLPIKYDAPDGSVWLRNSGVIIPYTSEYAVANQAGLVGYHKIIDGPVGAAKVFLYNLNAGSIPSVVYKKSNTMFVTCVYDGHTSLSGYYYYTSTDGGVTWTRRQAPASGTIKYDRIYFCNDRFFLIASGTTTNGIAHSLDGINWTVGNLPSTIATGTVLNIVSNTSNIYIISSNGSSSYIKSTDSGKIGRAHV